MSRFFSQRISHRNADFLTIPTLLLALGTSGCGGGSSSSPANSPTAQATPVANAKPTAVPTSSPTAVPTSVPTPVATATPTAPLRVPSEQFPLRLACVGDSITVGEGVGVPDRDSYPALLSGLLGKSYNARRFGYSGSTLLLHSGLPYQKQTTYAAALAFKPESVVVALGTNDAFVAPASRIKAEWPKDYRRLIEDFRTKAGTTRFYLCIPPANYNSGSPRDAIITRTIAPIIRQLAAEIGASVVDLHAATQKHPEWFPDGLHPNEAGARRIAAEINKVIRASP